jgi:hypothetical protein
MSAGAFGTGKKGFLQEANEKEKNMPTASFWQRKKSY